MADLGAFYFRCESRRDIQVVRKTLRRHVEAPGMFTRPRFRDGVCTFESSLALDTLQMICAVEPSLRDIEIVKCCCGKGNGWWCQGCGSHSKMEGLMKRYTMTEDDADDVVDDQWGSCGTLVPCLICNYPVTKKGQNNGYDIKPAFWGKAPFEFVKIH